MKIQTNQNFLSVDSKTARSSYGEFFTVGEKVAHDDKSAGVAEILSFMMDTNRNEIRVNTTKGYAHLDFLVKVEQN